MKARSTAIQGALALLALAAAYLTWQRPKETAKAESVVVMSASKQSLEKIHFEDGTRQIDLVKKTDPESRWWVTTSYLAGKTPVFDAGVPSLDAGVMAKAPQPLPTRELLANDRMDALVGRLTPLEGTRALGALPKEKLEELGLAGSERHFDVTVAGQTRHFLVSKPLAGIIGSYLQDEKGEVYLMPGAMLSELDPNSQVLVDRRLHTFKQSEFDHFTIALDGKRGEFVQTNADIPQSAKVAKVATPDKADEVAKNWHDKVWNRLVVTEVLGKGELPQTGEPVVSLRIEYTSRGAKKGFIEVGFDSTKGTWARSENTASWVALHQGAEELAIEAKRLVE